MKLALAIRRSSAARFSIEFGIQDYVRGHPEIEIVRVNDNHSLSWDEALQCTPDALVGFFYQPEHFQKVEEMEIPSVCINSIFDHGAVPCVRSNAYAAGVMAAEYFMQQGCHHFTYITDVPNHYYSIRRQAGFHDALKKQGHRMNCIASESLDSAALWVEKVLGENILSGVFCVRDQTARSLLNLLESKHPNLEDSVIVLGVDNDPFHYENGAIVFSSIDVNHRQVGYGAAELVHQYFKQGGGETRCVEIPPLRLHDRHQQARYLKHQHPALSMALDKITSDYANPELTAALVAEHSSLSVRSLNRLLKAQGYPPVATYILNARIGAAKKLLSLSNLTLEQIAYTVGFKEYTTFYRAFKKTEGVAPSDFS